MHAARQPSRHCVAVHVVVFGDGVGNALHYICCGNADGANAACGRQRCRVRRKTPRADAAHRVTPLQGADGRGGVAPRAARSAATGPGRPAAVGTAKAEATSGGWVRPHDLHVHAGRHMHACRQAGVTCRNPRLHACRNAGMHTCMNAHGGMGTVGGVAARLAAPAAGWVWGAPPGGGRDDQPLCRRPQWQEQCASPRGGGRCYAPLGRCR